MAPPERGSQDPRSFFAEAGVLYVVATPIGNLGDVSPRAADLLRTVDVVAAEDTRRSKTLLGHVGANPELVSCHQHSPPQRIERLVERLVAGRSVAILTDAGTPGVSDPGGHLVARARAAGVRVVPIPGASAVMTALSAAGLPADRFLFLGFLPRKGPQRRELLEMIRDAPWTVVVFEAAPRLNRLLTELVEVCGPARLGGVARELTKVYEDVRTGDLRDLVDHYQEEPPRGEVTLLVAGVSDTPRPAPDPDVVAQRGRELLTGGTTHRDTAAQLAREFGLPRNEAYRIVTTL